MPDIAPMWFNEKPWAKLTDSFSCEVNVLERSQNMYSLVCEYNSSFTRVFDGEFGLALGHRYQQVKQKAITLSHCTSFAGYTSNRPGSVFSVQRLHIFDFEAIHRLASTEPVSIPLATCG